MLHHPAPLQSLPHPRRPPAHLSVSLRRDSQSPASSACSRRAQPAQDDDSHKPTSAWKMLAVPRSSEESNESADVPADAWFDRSNQNVGKRLGQSFIDNSPPFFLQNQTYKLPYAAAEADVAAPHSHAFASTKSQFAPEYLHTATNGSSTDEFRSVIDDLTVENKKLKERLRRYEMLHSSPLEKDKLFEVRVYGLTPSKKRELEETLLAFASGISKGESTRTTTLKRSKKDPIQLTAPFRHSSKNISSLSTSNSRVVDSAYASLSASGPESLSLSNNVDNEKKKCGDLITASKAGQVLSFLDDIPPGLLPKHSHNMSERGKKKLVVRRLEQIFTGKMRVQIGPDSQSLQQQHVSYSAARDDRQAIQNRGQLLSAEGLREAHILSTEMEPGKMAIPKLSVELSGDSSEGAETSTTSPHSPDQRPTRPLDLDPDRAQVPADNIEYIRHLRISTPDLAPEDLTDAKDGHGWVYLNLLINMAQLHIINVTPDFVRSAVMEMSTKFQLSSDGSKIRWKGGTEGTEMSSDSGGDNVLRISPNRDGFGDSDSKRRKIDNNSFHVPAHDTKFKQGRFQTAPIASPSRPNQENGQKYFPFYKPLFAHHSSTEEEDMSCYDSISQISYLHANNSGICPIYESAQGGKAGSNSRASSKRKRGEGTIVFYSGAQFCTDLSGDMDLVPTPIHATDVGMDGFSNHSHDALGCRPNERPHSSLSSQSSYESRMGCKPFKDYSVCAKALTEHEGRSRTPETLEEEIMGELEFSPLWTEAEDQKVCTPMSFDVCGLGGTRPADHFVLRVKTRRKKLNREARIKYARFSLPSKRIQQFLHQIPKSTLEIFHQPNTGGDQIGSMPHINTTESPLQTEIFSTTIQYLDPSRLPPPATYHWALTNSSIWSDDTSSVDDDKLSGCVRRDSRFLQRASKSTSADAPEGAGFPNNEEEEEDDEEISSGVDGSDCSSTNMLATHGKPI